MIPYAKHDVTMDDMSAVMDVLESDHLTQGPKVQEFEEAFAEKCGAKYAVAVSSGTAALHLAMLACGNESWTYFIPAISFVATANAALYTGAEVKFVDTDPTTGLIDPTGLPKNSGSVVRVSLGGQPAPTKGHWPAVADSCHGPFALPEGVTAACFSLHPSKHVAAGEGGVVVTNNWFLASEMEEFRNHGRGRKVTDEKDDEGLPRLAWAGMYELGHNYRMPEMSAALALSQLKRLDWNIAKRRELAARYDEAFTDIETVPHSEHSARHLYQILVGGEQWGQPRHNRSVQRALAHRGVGTQVHYEPIIPLQPYYAERFGYKTGDFPQAEKYASRTLSLPLYPTLTVEEQDYVIEQVLEVLHEVPVV